MELKIATRSRSLSGEMMHLFSENKKIALADGVEIEFQGVEFNKGGIDLLPEVAAFVITVAQPFSRILVRAPKGCFVICWAVRS